MIRRDATSDRDYACFEDATQFESKLDAPSRDRFRMAIHEYCRINDPHSGRFADETNRATWYLDGQFLAYERATIKSCTMGAYRASCANPAWDIPPSDGHVLPTPRCGGVSWIWRNGEWLTHNLDEQRQFVRWLYGVFVPAESLTR